MDEFERLSAIIADGEQPPARRLDARIERAIMLIHMARWRESALDFTAVLEDPRCTPEQRGRALNGRAALYSMTKEHALALRDFEKVISDDQMPPNVRQMALNNAAISYEDTGNIQRAIEIYTLAIEDPNTEPQTRFMKRLARANAMKKAGLNATPEYDALLNDPETPRDIRRSAEYFKGKGRDA